MVGMTVGETGTTTIRGSPCPVGSGNPITTDLAPADSVLVSSDTTGALIMEGLGTAGLGTTEGLIIIQGLGLVGNVG